MCWRGLAAADPRAWVRRAAAAPAGKYGALPELNGTQITACEWEVRALAGCPALGWGRCPAAHPSPERPSSPPPAAVLPVQSWTLGLPKGLEVQAVQVIYGQGAKDATMWLAERRATKGAGR